MATEGSRTAVIAALTGNALIAVAKFGAAAVTGSAAMLSEAWHSVADTGNQALLLRGLSQSKRSPDTQHPFGRGKETYFWSFMVAVMLFVGGAVLSFQHGIEALTNPHELDDITVNVIVLGAAILIEDPCSYMPTGSFAEFGGADPTGVPSGEPRTQPYSWFCSKTARRFSVSSLH